MRKTIPAVCTLATSLLMLISSYAQDAYENKQVGIKLIKPRSWILASNADMETSLGRIKFNDEQMQELLRSKNGVVTICTYYKYNIDSVSGLIPTAKVTVRPNSSSNMDEFKQAMINSVDRLKPVVKNFELIDSLREVSISNHPALTYTFRYSLTLANRVDIQVRNRFYMIPKGSYFISISLMDNETIENCSQVFDQFIASLQLEK